MSGNRGSNAVTIHICPWQEEEEEVVWVLATLYRRQPVNLFSHNVSGGDEEKGIEMVGKYTELGLGFLQL